MKKHKIFNLKLFLIFWIFFLFFWNCKKEQQLQPQLKPVLPTIQIISTKTSSLTSFEIVIKTDIGVGNTPIKAEMVLQDLTDLNSSNIVMEIPLSHERVHIDTLYFRTDRLNHDFKAIASITTRLNTFFSEPKNLQSNKNSFLIDVFPDLAYSNPGLYSDLTNNIAVFRNRGTSFSILVEYAYKFKPSSVEVKLNRTISLTHTLTFEKYWYANNIETTGQVSIPNEIESGIYEVYVYLDGLEFKTKNNIKLLRGNWEKINPNYPAGQIGQRGMYAWFVKNDNVYVIGGEYYSSMLENSPVWKYNITSNSWVQKKDFPHPGDVTKNKIFPFQIQYKNEAYILLRNDQLIEIWKYQEESDNWSFISTYPGEANNNTISLQSNEKLYIGGGYEFWGYDLEKNLWGQLNNVPEEILHGTANSPYISCGLYLLCHDMGLDYSELWQYNIENDTWTKKMKLPGHIRISSNMVEMNNKLYVLGGTYLDPAMYGLKDCWEYSIETDTWELIAYMPELYSHGIAFIYNNFIYAGLGWVLNGYSSFYEQNFYKLDIN